MLQIKCERNDGTMDSYKPLLTLLTIFLVLIAAASASADTIKLKNGQAFEGVITAEESERVQMKVSKSGVQIWFTRNQILSLDKATANDKPTPKRNVQSKETSDKADTTGLDEDAIRARELLKKMREQPSVGPEKENNLVTSPNTGERKETLPSGAPFKGLENARVSITVFSDYQ